MSVVRRWRHRSAVRTWRPIVFFGLIAALVPSAGAPFDTVGPGGSGRALAGIAPALAEALGPGVAPAVLAEALGSGLPPTAGYRPAEPRLAPRVLQVNPRSFTLKSGMEGQAVTFLQRRLAELHYDLGEVDGAFGPSTHHAVVSFQKANGLKPSGIVGPNVWHALDHPVAPKPQYRLQGTYIEVDITKQLLYYVVDGTIDSIVDASTGAGHWFEVDGEPRLAVTNMGSWEIYKQIPGWNMSSVGGMYHSSFFQGREAIHGYYEVPPYPDSHGCVRVTIQSMDRLWPKMYMGMPVYIYRS